MCVKFLSLFTNTHINAYSHYPFLFTFYCDPLISSVNCLKLPILFYLIRNSWYTRLAHYIVKCFIHHTYTLTISYVPSGLANNNVLTCPGKIITNIASMTKTKFCCLEHIVHRCQHYYRIKMLAILILN